MRRAGPIGKFVTAAALLGLTTLASAATAQASEPPVAVTGSPVNVAYTSATVTGDAGPGGSSSNWYFQYGVSTSYGLKTAVVAAGSGVTTVPVSVTLTGLQPGVHYHYRLVVTSETATSFGLDASFETPVSPPSVSTRPASHVSDTAAVLDASIDPHGLQTVARFQYGTSSSYGLATATHSVGRGTVAVAFAIAVSQLARGTTYHARVLASNAAGTTVGADVTFETPGPAVVTTGAASEVSASQATLNGTLNPDGHPTSWYFQYGSTTSYGAKTAVRSAGAGLVPVAVSAKVAGLVPGNLYHARLVARSGDGVVVGGDVTVTTPGPTVFVSSPTIVFGRPVTISGSIPTGAVNSTVTLFAQDATDSSFIALATVLTGAEGSWSFTSSPRLATSYKAMWNGVATPVAAVQVRPSVSLRAASHGEFFTHVRAAHPLSGRLVRLQGLHGARWVAFAAVRLDNRSRAVFRPQRIPSGISMVRVLLTGYQAGPGYLAGFSRAQPFVRR